MKGVTGEEGSTEGILRGRGREGRCAEVGEEWHRERCWPARPRGSQPQKAAHLILRNHLYKFTDLSANPGVR